MQCAPLLPSMGAWGCYKPGERGRPQREGLSSHGLLPYPVIVLLVAIGYYAGPRIGFLFTPPQTPTAAFWPPNAILLAAFLITPVRKWWALLLAVLPAHLLVQLHAGIPVSSMLGWFVGNTGEALLGAAC